MELVYFDRVGLFALEVAEHVVEGADGLALPLESLEQLEEVAGHEEGLDCADHVALGIFVGDSAVHRIFLFVYLVRPDVSGCYLPRSLALEVVPSCLSFIF